MQKFNSTKRDREFSAIRLKVQELNNVIEEAVKKVGSNAIYLDKSSTFISAPDSIWPLQEVTTDEDRAKNTIVFEQKCIDHLEMIANGEKAKVTYDRFKFVYEQEEDDGEWYIAYFGSSYSFKDDVAWLKKCIRQAIKFYESEDPDAYLEQPEEEEEE